MKKKLLILPFAFFLTTTPILALSACSNKWEKKGNDGSQILIKLPGLKFNNLNSFNDENISEITIKKLLDSFINNEDIQKEIFTEVTKRLHLAVIKTEKDTAYWKKDYKRLMSDIDNYINEDWKQLQGANWEKKLKDEIKKWGNKESFKEYLLLNMDIPANVYTRMRSKFIDSFQNTYKKYTISNIATFANSLIDKMLKKDFDINNWYSNNAKESRARNTALKEAYNYKNDDELKNNITKDFNNKPINEDKLYIYDDKGNVQLDEINTEINKLTLEQKFIAEQWYNNLKPLHVSQITFKYDGKDKNGLENGIEEKDFEEKNGNGEKINKFLKESNKNFEELAQIYSDDNKDTYGEISKLLTLTSDNSDFSAMFKTSTYSLALNQTEEIDAPSDYKQLIKELHRGSKEKPSNSLTKNAEENNKNEFLKFKSWKINNEKIVAFADTNEVRFVKINGWDELQKGYIKSDNDVEKPNENGIIEAISNKKNVRLQKTPYLQYLIDHYKENANKKNKFNPIDDIKTYANFTTSNIESNNNWWFWFWDVMAWKPWKKDNETTDLNWYKKYITFEGEIGKKWQQAIDKMFKSYITSRSLSKINDLIIKLQEENITIEKIKDAVGSQVDLKINIEKLRDEFLNNSKNLWNIISNNPKLISKDKNTNFSINYSKWWKNFKGGN